MTSVGSSWSLLSLLALALQVTRHQCELGQQTGQRVVVESIEYYADGGYQKFMVAADGFPVYANYDARVHRLDFTSVSVWPKPHDLAVVKVYKDGSFDLESMHGDCWAYLSVFAWDTIKEICCDNNDRTHRHFESCFGSAQPDYVFHRCCHRMQIGKAYLEQDMEAARKSVSAIIPHHRVDEAKFNARRMKHRIGTKDTSCGELVPKRTYPESMMKNAGDRSLLAAYEVLSDAGMLTNKVFQAGLNDGVAGDPLHPIVMLYDVEGVGMEASEFLANLSRRNRPGRFRVVEVVVTPQNIWQWVGPLGELDVLVIDIDSWDCAILETIFKGYASRAAKQPSLVYIELNMMVPPPFFFNRGYNVTAGLGVVNEMAITPTLNSCSLSYAVHLCARYGYYLLMYAHADALFVRSDLADVYRAAGYESPKDEFRCYRENRITIASVMPDYIREWFFRADDPGDLHASLKHIGNNISKLRGADLVYAHHPYFLGFK